MQSYACMCSRGVHAAIANSRVQPTTNCLDYWRDLLGKASCDMLYFYPDAHAVRGQAIILLVQQSHYKLSHVRLSPESLVHVVTTHVNNLLCISLIMFKHIAQHVSWD